MAKRLSQNDRQNDNESLEAESANWYEREHNKVVANTHPDTCYAGRQVKRHMTLDQLDAM